MRNWIRNSTLCLSIVGLSALSSCIVTSSSGNPTGTSYTFGYLDGVVNGTPQNVVKAATSVLEEQEMQEISQAATGLDGKVTAKTALGTNIGITVNKKDDTTCKISIKVGSFGDHQISVDLYEKVKAKLP